MAEPNVLLDALIDRARLSHAGLAKRINTLGADHGLRYDHASVARWIRDHAIPRDPAPALICQILGAALGMPLSRNDIGMTGALEQPTNVDLPRFVNGATALWRGDRKARTPGSAVTGAEAITPVWEWENPPEDSDIARPGERPVAQADIRALRRMRDRYQEMYRRVGGVPVRPRLVASLNQRAAPLLHGAYDNAIGRELFRAAGGLAALAGVCAYDADQQPLAQRYLFGALRMAKASGAQAFGAYIVALLATHALHLDQHRLVVQYAAAALRTARGPLTPALATDLHALAGKAYARMGDAAACHAHIRQSEATAARIDHGNEPAEVSYVQPGLVETQLAEALRRLGDLTAAQTYAEESIRTAGTTHLRGRVHRYAGLSLILTARGDIEQSVTVAGRMLDAAEGMESGRIRDRIASVTCGLRPYAAMPDVADLLERAAAHEETGDV
jgi:hypothetical protein